MKKVICIDSGNQTNERPVKVGSIYTVCRIVKGWEILVKDTDADFYMLVEMGSLKVYHSKLFADITDNVESELTTESLTNTL